MREVLSTELGHHGETSYAQLLNPLWRWNAGSCQAPFLTMLLLLLSLSLLLLLLDDPGNQTSYCLWLSLQHHLTIKMRDDSWQQTRGS